jgi:tetratricopeptide (TPR) repeat protein
MNRTAAALLLFGLLSAHSVSSWAEGEGPEDGYGSACGGISGSPAQIIESCSAAIASEDPADTQILPLHLATRATAYEQIGDYDRALADLDRAILLVPDAADRYRERGQPQIKRKDFSAALNDMDTLVRLRPDDPWSYAYRGWTGMMSGTYNRALADLDRSILMNEPGGWWPLLTRAKVLLLLGRPNDAMEDYDRALAIVPGHARLYLDRGIARVLRDRAQGDRDQLPISVRLNSDFDAASKGDVLTSLYARLWTFATRTSPLEAFERQLAAAIVARRETATWPAPLLAFYGGQVSEGEVLKAIASAEKDSDRFRCEAAFFVGMMKLRSGALGPGRLRLSEAVQICPAYTGESLVAKAKLAAM